MKVNAATKKALDQTVQNLRYFNKRQEIRMMEERLRWEQLKVEKLRPRDPTKGNSVDVMA